MLHSSRISWARAVEEGRGGAGGRPGCLAWRVATGPMDDPVAMVLRAPSSHQSIRGLSRTSTGCTSPIPAVADPGHHRIYGSNPCRRLVI
jgi:hypothetical protein